MWWAGPWEAPGWDEPRAGKAVLPLRGPSAAPSSTGSIWTLQLPCRVLSLCRAGMIARGRLQENFASWFVDWLITERKGWGGEWRESKKQQMVSSLHPCPKLLQIHHPPSFELNTGGCSERWVSAKRLFQLSPKSSVSEYSEWGPGVRHLKSVIKHKKYVSGFPGSWFTQLGKKGLSG